MVKFKIIRRQKLGRKSPIIVLRIFVPKEKYYFF